MEKRMSVNIKEKYKDAVASIPDSQNDEITTLLHKTPWVRILLEQRFDESDNNRIEVEVTVPDERTCDQKDRSTTFDEFDEHINYLKKLREHGFELCIIGDGCILSASKSFQKTPEDNLFSALLPP
jgi:hypothetical protein